MSKSSAEDAAIRREAEARLRELTAVQDMLLPDADDAEVMSELTAVAAEVAACRRALVRADDTDREALTRG